MPPRWPGKSKHRGCGNRNCRSSAQVHRLPAHTALGSVRNLSADRLDPQPGGRPKRRRSPGAHSSRVRALACRRKALVRVKTTRPATLGVEGMGATDPRPSIPCWRSAAANRKSATSRISPTCWSIRKGHWSGAIIGRRPAIRCWSAPSCTPGKYSWAAKAGEGNAHPRRQNIVHRSSLVMLVR